MGEEIVTLCPLGSLGYGIPERSLDIATENHDFDVIGMDAGSVDQGPHYLGHGTSHTDDAIVRRDLELVLQTAHEEDAPLLIGTFVSAGSREHLDHAADIAADIVESRGYDLYVARMYTDVEREFVERKIESDEISQIGYEHDLTVEDVEDTKRIVGQVGHEPFVEALNEGADVVFAGRALDTAPFTAVPLMEGFDPGIVCHFAKIMECGSQATTTGAGNDSLVGVVGEDYFEVEPPNPNLRCTTQSVAAHTLYEKSDPYIVHTTNGRADVSNAEFTQLSDRQVRVTGSEFQEADSPSVKIEGVEQIGYRTISLGGIRDPTLLDHLDSVLRNVKEVVSDRIGFDEGEYTLQFRRYGYDGVPLGGSDEERTAPEIGIVIDVLGERQETADTVCALARATLLHQHFEERVAIGGNIAFPYSPSDISCGPVYRFSIYHVLEATHSNDVAELEWGFQQ